MESPLDGAKQIFRYRNSIPTFVEEVLLPANSYGIEELSDHQKEFLDDMSDLSNNRAIISASRNSGKTITLAILAVWSVSVLPYFTGNPYKVVILAGSLKQSQQLYQYVKGWFENSDFLNEKLADKPKKTHTDLKDGSFVSSLAASEKQIRGHHPNCLIMDEAAEMDDDIVNSALPMVLSKTPNRIIMSSTPHRYHSKFVDYWFDSKDGNNSYDNYHWSISDCDWIDQQSLEEIKKEFDKATASVELEGLPYKKEGSVFNSEDIRACVVNRELDVQPDTYKVMGIDYGMAHPTVIIVVQVDDDGVFEVLETKAFTDTRFKVIREQVSRLYNEYEVSVVYGDDSHKSVNQELQAEGLNLIPTSFSGGAKPYMVNNLKNKIEKHQLRIPYTEEKLIRELDMYQYKTTSTGKETFRSKKDDYVDALVLACKYDAKSGSDMFFVDVG